MKMAVGGTEYYSEYKANKFCAREEGTRLATLTTTQDKAELWNWLTKDGEDTAAQVKWLFSSVLAKSLHWYE